MASGATAFRFFRVAVVELLDRGLVFKCYSFSGHNESLSCKRESNRAEALTSDLERVLQFGGLFHLPSHLGKSDFYLFSFLVLRLFSLWNCCPAYIVGHRLPR